MAALPNLADATPVARSISRIVAFRHSAFPYRGMLPDGSAPFLDVVAGDRRGHTSPRGGVYWEDETYSDRGVLIAVPKHFDPARPAVIVVFFHGNGATLERDVAGRQRVVAQVEACGLNAVLVAPQLAFDALDSSAGNFWTAGFFAAFMQEAAETLAALTGGPEAKFNAMPVVIAAYSGGYNPAAYTLDRGGAGSRVAGVILLDAAFGETDTFVRWISGRARTAFFASAYGDASSAGNAQMMTALSADGIRFARGAPRALRAGTICFIASHAPHDSFVTRAFVSNPLQWLLGRITDYRR